MALKSNPSTLRFARRINMKNDARHLTPVGVVRLGVEKPRIGDSVLLIVGCQGGFVRRRICNFDMSLRHYRNSYKSRSFDIANAGCTRGYFLADSLTGPQVL